MGYIRPPPSILVSTPPLVHSHPPLPLLVFRWHKTSSKALHTHIFQALIYNWMLWYPVQLLLLLLLLLFLVCPCHFCWRSLWNCPVLSCPVTVHYSRVAPQCNCPVHPVPSRPLPTSANTFARVGLSANGIFWRIAGMTMAMRWQWHTDRRKSRPMCQGDSSMGINTTIRITIITSLLLSRVPVPFASTSCNDRAIALDSLDLLQYHCNCQQHSIRSATRQLLWWLSCSMRTLTVPLVTNQLLSAHKHKKKKKNDRKLSFANRATHNRSAEEFSCNGRWLRRRTRSCIGGCGGFSSCVPL